MSTRAFLTVACVTLLACLPLSAEAQTKKTQAPSQTQPKINILRVKDHVYMLVGERSNSTVMITDAAVLVVDAMDAVSAPQLIEAIQTLSDKPILYLINTHAHDSSVGGNEAFSKVGTANAPPRVGLGMDAARDTATIISHENVSLQLSQEQKVSPHAWPTQTYFYGDKELYFGGEAIRMIHEPNAHTDGDTLVYFRGSDVISTGDLFSTTNYPIIDRKHGGTVAGVIAALNNILDIAIPAHHQEGGTMIIPGRGRLCDEHDVLEYRDMVVIVRARVKDLVDKGMTLEQVKRARPALDYDRRYGAGAGDWTTDDFIGAIFAELRTKP